MIKTRFDYSLLKAPCLALIHNLEFFNNESLEKIEFGQLIATDESFSALKKQVPKPKQLNDLKSIMKLAGRENLIECMDDSLIEEINDYPEEEFLEDFELSKEMGIKEMEKQLFGEDDPYYFNVNLEPYHFTHLMKDLDVFGESYTIVFFVPNDKVKVKEFILNRINALKRKDKSNYEIFKVIHYCYLENSIESSDKEVYGQEIFEYIHEILPPEISAFFN